MLEQLVQKFLSAVPFCALGLPQSLVAVYFLDVNISIARWKEEEYVLDHIFAFGDFEGVCYAPQIHAATIAPNFPADGAGAKLVGNWCVRLQSEFDGTIMAASFERPAIKFNYSPSRHVLQALT